MPIDFNGQVAIVTGAGRGLGRSHALALAARGARIVVNDPGRSLVGDLEGSSPAASVVAEIEQAGGTAIADTGDVQSADDVSAMIDRAMAAWGRIDVVVNNAGNMHHKLFSETSNETLLSQLSIHALGSLQVSRAAFPHMRAAGYGRIVLTTSQVGMYGQLDATGYGAAKAAIVGLMHGMKLELDGTGVTVNCLSPFALTRMAPSAFPVAMQAWMGAEQVSPAVVFLASRECLLNGEVLIAGGGHFGIARTIESRGIDFETPEGIIAEAIAERYAAISDLTDALRPADALGAVQRTFDRIEALTHAGRAEV